MTTYKLSEHDVNIWKANPDLKEAYPNVLDGNYNHHINKDFTYLDWLRIHLPQERESRNAAVEKMLQPFHFIDNICDKFCTLVKVINSRHKQKPLISIENEYNAQDLFHALMLLYFDEIHPEEWTPSYAGSSARMDFLLKSEKIVIEIKITRKNATQTQMAKEVGDQLIVDIERYKKYPGIETLICFVYDPENIFISNRNIIKRDLEKLSTYHFNVIVYISR